MVNLIKGWMGGKVEILLFLSLGVPLALIPFSSHDDLKQGSQRLAD